MIKRLNIGVIGVGRIGRVHAENLAFRIPEANLVAVADDFLKAAESLAKELQIPAVYRDHGRIMEDEIIDAVLI